MTDQQREIPENLPEQVQQRLAAQWAQFQEKLADENWVTKNLSTHIDELFRVWGFSEFAASLCVGRPSILVDLINSNDLFRRYPEGFYSNSLRHQLVQINSETELHQCLRN